MLSKRFGKYLDWPLSVWLRYEGLTSHMATGQFEAEYRVTKLLKIGAAKLEHEYSVFRGDELLATARSVLACVDRDGQVQRIPEDVAATCE